MSSIDNIGEENISDFNQFSNYRYSLVHDIKREQKQKKMKYLYINILDKVIRIKACSNIDHEIRFIEFNPDFHLYDSMNSFWDFVEIEHKMDILYDEYVLAEEMFLKTFQNKELSYYSFGSFDNDVTYERFRKMQFENFEEYYVVLGKKNWKRKPAIKYKKEIQFYYFARQVKLMEYNNENVDKLIKEIEDYNGTKLINTYNYKPYYKHKMRSIVVDTRYGYVYGLSLNKAVLKREKHYDNFCQIEIEYWSKIIKENSVKDECKNFYSDEWKKSYTDLISLIRNSLANSNIMIREPGRCKHEWISNVT